MRVLFILGCNEGPSKRYRVFNHIEALAARGIAGEWVWDIHPEVADEDYMRRFSIVVNFRGGYSDRLERMFALLKRLGIPTVYDIDDLVFDSTLARHIDAYRKMSVVDQKNYTDGMKSMGQALAHSDYATTSTSFLSDHIRQLTGKDVWVVPFGVNERQIEIAKRIEPYTGGPRFIGYLSGTKTHDRDFAEAAAALRVILAEYPDVYLKLVGFLNIEEHLPGLNHKVIRVPFMDWQDLVIEVASLYINIAPFEPESLFCQSKSDLKYVEPALSNVPTIASPIRSFQDSIRSGVNGYIACGPGEWEAAFRALLDNPEVHDRVGYEANLDIQRERTPASIGKKLEDTYREIIALHGGDKKTRVPRKPRSAKAGLRIAWVIPQPFEGSGGHRNIFRAIKYLSEFGHSCSLHVLPDNHRFSQGSEIADFITQEFFNINAEVFHGVNSIEECDVMVCTYWTTAYVVQKNASKAALHVYFLQDFEPYFFPMGTDYVRACETYKFGFYPITSGPWPLRMLESQFGVKRGSFFRFPLDRDIYYPPLQSEPRQTKRIAYFGRPDMPRRCYPLGVAALEIVKAKRLDVEIVFYGDHAHKYVNTPFAFTNLGMTPRIEDLGDLYRSVDVGLCFSTTNPSLVPFEMMACGCPVVDLDVNSNEVNYGSRENCVLASANPEAIADAVLSVLDDPNKRASLSARGIEYAKIFPTEEEMARIIEGEIVAEYAAAKELHYAASRRRVPQLTTA